MESTRQFEHLGFLTLFRLSHFKPFDFETRSSISLRFFILGCFVHKMSSLGADRCRLSLMPFYFGSLRRSLPPVEPYG